MNKDPVSIYGIDSVIFYSDRTDSVLYSFLNVNSDRVNL